MPTGELLTAIYSPNTRRTCHLSICVWIRDMKTITDCDVFIDFVKGRYSEVIIFAIDDGVSPKEWGGTSIIGKSSTTSVAGKTPWAYLYDKLHAARIKVTAWIWITHFSYWGGTSGVDIDIPNTSTYNDAGIWNFHNITARATIIDEIKDFVDNNSMEALAFDMEGTTSNIITQDMTDFVTAIRTEIPNKEMIWFVGGTDYTDSVNKLDSKSWLRNNHVDALYLMGYYNCIEEKTAFFNNNEINKNDARINAGIGGEDNFAAASDFRHRWLLLKNDGYRSYFHFIWESNFENDANLRNAVDTFLDNTIAAVQDNITKVSLTPSTSWTITVGGVNQTTNYADVTGHLYSGPLKDHVETAIGSENPAVIYFRNNSTTTKILVGDFEP